MTCNINQNFMCLSPENKSIFFACSSKLIKQFLVETGECIMTYSGHKGVVFYLTMSADGCDLFSLACQGTAKHWDVATGKCKMTFAKDEDKISVSKLLPLMSINAMIVLYSDGNLAVYDIASGLLIKTLKKHSDCVTKIIIYGVFVRKRLNNKDVKFDDLMSE